MWQRVPQERAANENGVTTDVPIGPFDNDLLLHFMAALLVYVLSLCFLVSRIES